MSGKKNNNAIDKATFLRLFNLPGVLGEVRICDRLCEKRFVYRTPTHHITHVDVCPQRVFAVFDGDRNESIDHDEFLDGLRTLMRGTSDEKALFIFQSTALACVTVLSRLLHSACYTRNAQSTHSTHVLLLLALTFFSV